MTFAVLAVVLPEHIEPMLARIGTPFTSIRWSFISIWRKPTVQRSTSSVRPSGIRRLSSRV